MFDLSARPGLYQVPLGVDFGQALVDGLLERAATMPPQDFARIEIYVNTQRMKRRVIDLLTQGPARLLPKVRLLTELAQTTEFPDIPAAVHPLRRRLELTQLVAQLLDAAPDLAPKSALFDLSDSLARLMDEMQSEGVDPAAISMLDVSSHSEHWARTQSFLSIVQHYFNADATAPDTEARQRLIIERLTAKWETAPPSHPVIIAGSTGSRGGTARLMTAVAKLPQGAVVLPGFDTRMTDSVWDRLSEGAGLEDHPQYRFRALADTLEVALQEIAPWMARTPAAADRNAMISLALRPAPVTDQWLHDGPKLPPLVDATKDLTLVEAPGPREEAEGIALGMREAIAAGKSVALISPDRNLTRRVTAALDLWGVLPDDSAGQPLPQTPPGRFLRHVAQLFGRKITAEDLLVLLKHPLTHSAGDDRGQHLLRTRELELHLRRYGPPFPDRGSLTNWTERTGEADPGRLAWGAWVADLLDLAAVSTFAALGSHADRHVALAELVARGPSGEGSGELWDEAAGREALRVVTDLRANADAAGDVTAPDYASIFSGVLSSGQVRNPDTGRPDVLILGTLEARVQSADLVILGGLNEGIWPQAPSPDPWLNRKMRQEAGLLLPERQTGLSAHDFEQAVTAPEVWITRSIRSDEAETVPSRWVNRILNLLDGLPGNGGPDAIKAMRARGAEWLAAAKLLGKPDTRIAPAPRPSPKPPAMARPSEISVTEVKTLIRDPYAIYAKRVLGLKELDPLSPEPDAPLRGIIIHRILERFVFDDPGAEPTLERLLTVAREEFDAQCPWPTIRELWMARFVPVAEWFVETEAGRRLMATPSKAEARGQIDLAGLGVQLTARADRIDRADYGSVVLYDYKSGAMPTKPQQQHFDKQLLLQSAMISRGAFTDVPAADVSLAQFIGVGGSPKVVAAPFKECPPDDTWDGFVKLMQRWQDPGRGYSARLAMFSTADLGRYDHLARFGEWDLTAKAEPEVVE